VLLTERTDNRGRKRKGAVVDFFVTIIEVLANEEWCSDGEQLIVVAAGVGFGWSWNRELRVLWLFYIVRQICIQCLQQPLVLS